MCPRYKLEGAQQVIQKHFTLRRRFLTIAYAEYRVWTTREASLEPLPQAVRTQMVALWRRVRQGAVIAALHLRLLSWGRLAK